MTAAISATTSAISTATVTVTEREAGGLAAGRPFATICEVMAIPNVKRFRPFCPTCNDNFTLMAVLPKDTNVDKYLADAVARHDHKAFQESKVLHFKVRVGQQKQKKAK